MLRLPHPPVPRWARAAVAHDGASTAGVIATPRDGAPTAGGNASALAAVPEGSRPSPATGTPTRSTPAAPAHRGGTDLSRPHSSPADSPPAQARRAHTTSCGWPTPPRRRLTAPPVERRPRRGRAFRKTASPLMPAAADGNSAPTAGRTGASGLRRRPTGGDREPPRHDPTRRPPGPHPGAHLAAARGARRDPHQPDPNRPGPACSRHRRVARRRTGARRCPRRAAPIAQLTRHQPHAP